MDRRIMGYTGVQMLRSTYHRSERVCTADMHQLSSFQLRHWNAYAQTHYHRLKHDSSPMTRVLRLLSYHSQSSNCKRSWTLSCSRSRMILLPCSASIPALPLPLLPGMPMLRPSLSLLWRPPLQLQFHQQPFQVLLQITSVIRHHLLLRHC